MAVRSDCVVHGAFTIPAAGFLDMYTVPADRTLILKDLRAYIMGSGFPIAFVAVDGANLALVFRVPAPTDDAVYTPDPPPWVVLKEGRKLQVHGGLGDVIYVIASGSLLEGDPA